MRYAWACHYRRCYTWYMEIQFQSKAIITSYYPANDSYLRLQAQLKAFYSFTLIATAFYSFTLIPTTNYIALNDLIIERWPKNISHKKFDFYMQIIKEQEIIQLPGCDLNHSCHMLLHSSWQCSFFSRHYFLAIPYTETEKNTVEKYFGKVSLTGQNKLHQNP